MPLYCVRVFMPLFGRYYMYRIRTVLAVNRTIDSQNLLVLVNALKWLLRTFDLRVLAGPDSVYNRVGGVGLGWGLRRLANFSE